MGGDGAGLISVRNFAVGKQVGELLDFVGANVAGAVDDEGRVDGLDEARQNAGGGAVVGQQQHVAGNTLGWQLGQGALGDVADVAGHQNRAACIFNAHN